MKKIFLSTPIVLISMFILSGYSTVDRKIAGQSIVYFSATILSLLLLVGCLFLVQKKKTWFVLLFSSVLVVNIGYTFLSVSTNLTMALWANRVAYLGSVFLPLAMLMIILDVSGAKYPRWLHGALGILSVIIFIISASPGILPIYYKEVAFEVVNGVSRLIKVYGPLHPLYLFYLIGYFTTMVAVIIRANAKKTIDTTAHAIVLIIAVFVNLGVWLIEQLTSIDFEFLSISYIISELFLLGIHLVMKENQKLRATLKQVESVQNYSSKEISVSGVMLEKPVENVSISPERIEAFMLGIKALTPTEHNIYNAYIARVTTNEIMANMNIKESTLKYHNRNIYGKLGVSSRKELLEIHKYLKSVKTVLDDTNKK